jgi:hypothetical protein
VNNLRQAAKQALEALEYAQSLDIPHLDEHLDALDNLRTALAEPEQEPVAHLWQHGETGRTRIIGNNEVWTASNQWFCAGPLYLGSAPTPRKPLTDEQIDELSRSMVRGDKSVNWLCRAIERAHGIGEQT